MTPVQHIVIVGLMGAGKTTVGELLTATIQLPMRDCDDLLEARVGRSAAQIAAAEGLDALHRLEADVLLDALAMPPPSVITAAASTIEDARCRTALAGAFVVWLRAEISTLVARVRAEDHRPLRDDVAAQLESHASRRGPLFAEVADLIIDVDLCSADEIVRAIVENTGPPRAVDR